MSASNLPPGCSSPDGGIDHEWEAAFELLAEALPEGYPDQMLEHVADELQHPGYIVAFSKMVATTNARVTAETAKSFFEAMTSEYKAGHDDGMDECRQIIELEGRVREREAQS